MLLPIANYKNEIINAVRKHSFTIISAETGSGKSTQVAQYLKDFFSQIVITEPRIMASKTLAKRVANEMNVTLGKEIGYNTAYDKCYSLTSNILYCTDGLQLIRTIFSEDNETEKVLIIDEVHEWNMNIETLVAWCKYMQGKWNTKVIIMSATLETGSLAQFLGEDVAVLNIPGNLYDVSFEERPECMLISTIRENINDGKNVLVFVPGKREIENVIEKLQGTNATVLPLHGEMDWEEQKKCFDHYPNSKVIVATNVAQTSITIPDIDVVVDTGKARISIAEDGIQGIFLVDISCADIAQRKGRAGRTKNGKYILCSDTPMEFRDKYTIPEIQRSILDRVVLQLATCGLDAEKLQFYHQPDLDAIRMAKKELVAIGAISDNKVTEIGYKIVRIPLSVQVARMVIEAEKYGVTDQVITIAAIVEMGGLLTKAGEYYDFTSENKSDLLAEFDVWKSINKIAKIDFEKLGIKKKSFFKIKEHIKKLKEALYGIIEITSNEKDREAIVKSCLCGLVSHIYVKDCDNYYDEDGTELQLDRNSCISYYSQLIIGIPKTIQFIDRYGRTNSLSLVSFASKIDVKTLFMLVPNKIIEEKSLRYSQTMDTVEITIKRSFAGFLVDTETKFDKDHPKYAELKAEYEANLNRGNTSNYRQEVIVIDGKQFKVYYDFWDKREVVYLDNETLFTTNVKEVFLDSGEKVYFSSNSLINRKETNITALRNAVENKRIFRIREEKEREYANIKINGLEDVIKNTKRIGEIELTMNNGGYGDRPILVYGYIKRNIKTVSFRIGDDEEAAKSDTLEALQFLFLKESRKRYEDRKFSHQGGKKKKIRLTESEKKLKDDFESFVNDVLRELTLENIQDNLEIIEEYYQDLMSQE